MCIPFNLSMHIFYYIQNNLERIPKLFLSFFFTALDERRFSIQNLKHQLRIMFGPQAIFLFPLHVNSPWKQPSDWEMKEELLNHFHAHFQNTTSDSVEWICLRWLYDDLKIVYGCNLNKSNSCKIAISLSVYSQRIYHIKRYETLEKFQLPRASSNNSLSVNEKTRHSGLQIFYCDVLFLGCSKLQLMAWKLCNEDFFGESQ